MQSEKCILQIWIFMKCRYNDHLDLTKFMIKHMMSKRKKNLLGSMMTAETIKSANFIKVVNKVENLLILANYENTINNEPYRISSSFSGKLQKAIRSCNCSGTGGQTCSTTSNGI